MNLIIWFNVRANQKKKIFYCIINCFIVSSHSYTPHSTVLKFDSTLPSIQFDKEKIVYLFHQAWRLTTLSKLSNGYV